MRLTGPTQDPIPSSDTRDLLYNTEKLDEWATSIARKYTDRFGVDHLTSTGMELTFKDMVAEFKEGFLEVIRGVDFPSVGTFQKGVSLPNNEITLRNQIIQDENTLEWYFWDGALPKQVLPGSTVDIGEGKWLGVGENSFRSQLLNKDGYSQIGEFPSVENLRSHRGRKQYEMISVSSFHYDKGVGGGNFRWYPNSALDDDGFSVINPNQGAERGRWCHVNKGRLTPLQCGCISDITFDSYVYLQRWLNQGAGDGIPSSFWSKTELKAPDIDVNIDGKGMTIYVTEVDQRGIYTESRQNVDFKITNLNLFHGDKRTGTIFGTIAGKNNGFDIFGRRTLHIEKCSAEGWGNAGIRSRGNYRNTIINNHLWRNDWDESAQMATGGDIVLYTSEPGTSKSSLIQGNVCLSDCSQGINVNALSSDRNININGNYIHTYSNSEYSEKDTSLMVKRHCVEIGYVGHQTYGGAVIVTGNHMTSSNWTGVYRSVDPSVGGVSFPPCLIGNNQIGSVGLKPNADRISGGIFLGDLVKGDLLINNLVRGFMGSEESAAYRIQDRSNSGSLNMVGNVDIDSGTNGILITGSVSNVTIESHTSQDPNNSNIRIIPASGSQFGKISIKGGKLIKSTPGSNIYIGRGLTHYLQIENVTAELPISETFTNRSIHIVDNLEKVEVRKNTFRGGDVGVWSDTYQNAEQVIPIGSNMFYGTRYAYRITRSAGTVKTNIEPNFLYGGTVLFTNGGVGTICGNEQLSINGTIVT